VGVEHSIGVIKQVFGFAKVRYRGLKKNTHRLLVTCAGQSLHGASASVVLSTGVVSPQLRQANCADTPMRHQDGPITPYPSPAEEIANAPDPRAAPYSYVPYCRFRAPVRRDRHQLGQPDQVVSRGRERKHPADVSKAAAMGVAEAGCHLGPAEHLLDALAHPGLRVVRPSMADCRLVVFCETCWVTLCSRRSATNAAKS
jgi:hypothetical protein